LGHNRDAAKGGRVFLRSHIHAKRLDNLALKMFGLNFSCPHELMLFLVLGGEERLRIKAL
ncbi:MAG: hypothetical protein WCF79_10645, partial [Rhodomicrobium sp.]